MHFSEFIFSCRQFLVGIKYTWQCTAIKHNLVISHYYIHPFIFIAMRISHSFTYHVNTNTYTVDKQTQTVILEYPSKAKFIIIIIDNRSYIIRAHQLHDKLYTMFQPAWSPTVELLLGATSSHYTATKLTSCLQFRWQST